LDERFESLIRKRVEDAERSTGRQLHSTRLEEDIRSAVSLFEVELKREHDNELDDMNSGMSLEMEEELPRQWITIRGLEPDPEKGLREDGMAITRCDPPTLEWLWLI